MPPGPPIAGDAMADAADPPEFLDIQVYQAAGPSVLVALDGDGGLEGAEPIQPVARQHSCHGGPAESEGAGDLGARPPLPAQPKHPRDELRARRRRLPPRLARAIPQASEAFGPVALDPFADGPLTHAERLRDVPPVAGSGWLRTPGRRPQRPRHWRAGHPREGRASRRSRRSPGAHRPPSGPRPARPRRARPARAWGGGVQTVRSRKP